METFLYLLKVRDASSDLPDAEKVEEPKGGYPCPCCGNLTLPVPQEEAVTYICPVCFWENDVFLTGDEEPSDENGGMTLRQAREQYQQMGACEQRFLACVRKPKPDEIPQE